MIKHFQILLFQTPEIIFYLFTGFIYTILKKLIIKTLFILTIGNMLLKDSVFKYNYLGIYIKTISENFMDKQHFLRFYILNHIKKRLNTMFKN
jgi:hypothetical protein